MRNENKSKLEKGTIIFKKLITKMTLEEKIGQIFQVGFIGTKITSEISEMIKDYHIGGIIYFKRNISRLNRYPIFQMNCRYYQQARDQVYR